MKQRLIKNQKRQYPPTIRRKKFIIGDQPYIKVDFYCGCCKQHLSSQKLDYMYCPYCGNKIDRKEIDNG